MTTFTWPDFGVNRFELRVVPNVRVYPNAFTSGAQGVDLGGEHWEASVTMTPGRGLSQGGQIEAFFDRLQGPVHRIALWHLRRPYPLGTLRDGSGTAVWRTNTNAVATWQTSAPAAAAWSHSGPVLYTSMAAGSNQLPVHRTTGTTVLAGDMLGCGGQLFRAMAAATADSSGQLLVEVQPRARALIPALSPVTVTRPTATFMLKSNGQPLSWVPGSYGGISFDLVEAPE